MGVERNGEYGQIDEQRQLPKPGQSTHDEEGGRFWSCHGQPGMYENGVKHSDTPDLIRQQGVQGQVWPITLQWMYPEKARSSLNFPV